MQVGVAHPGTQHSWQTALAAQEAGWLSWYATSFYYKTSQFPDSLVSVLPMSLRKKVERELRRRRFDPLDDRLILRHLETEFLERPLRQISPPTADLLCRLRHRRFPSYVLDAYRRRPVDIIWGPHDCLEAFSEITSRGTKCVLDQPIGHFRSLLRVMEAEFERNPDFFSQRPAETLSEATNRQDTAARIADVIVVGSEFASRTMVENGVDASKLRVIPYGYTDAIYPADRPIRPPLDGRPVEFIFVGSVGPRKGVPYLLEAFSRISPQLARLTLVGPLDMPLQALRSNLGNSRYLGQVTRDEVAAHMSRADCFVFPSLFEGGGIVLYEAAACGLGIIQSDRCGDGVRLDRNGIILPEISSEAIEAAVVEACRPSNLLAWQHASWASREERSWSAYRSGVRELLRDIAPGATAQ